MIASIFLMPTSEPSKPSKRLNPLCTRDWPPIQGKTTGFMKGRFANRKEGLIFAERHQAGVILA